MGVKVGMGIRVGESGVTVAGEGEGAEGNSVWGEGEGAEGDSVLGEGEGAERGVAVCAGEVWALRDGVSTPCLEVWQAGRKQINNRRKGSRRFIVVGRYSRSFPNGWR